MFPLSKHAGIFVEVADVLLCIALLEIGVDLLDPDIAHIAVKHVVRLLNVLIDPLALLLVEDLLGGSYDELMSADLEHGCHEEETSIIVSSRVNCIYQMRLLEKQLFL